MGFAALNPSYACCACPILGSYDCRRTTKPIAFRRSPLNDPWAFGWTQFLTIVGLLITVSIAWGGFRTFKRWKRERIEDKRIDLALEALAIAYEAKYVFDEIRSPMAFPQEWEDLPRHAGETEDRWRARGSYYAILKRIVDRKVFLRGCSSSSPDLWRCLGPTRKQFL
jgi:hypothetical protein